MKTQIPWKTFLISIFVLILTIPAHATEVAGRKVYCRDTKVYFSTLIPSEGANETNGINNRIILNPRLLRGQPKVVQWFIFYHECGHNYVGGNELKADCWAVNFGVKEGWLTKDSLLPICRSWDDTPATSTHPSARARCRNLNKCFEQATKDIANDKSANNIN